MQIPPGIHIIDRAGGVSKLHTFADNGVKTTDLPFTSNYGDLTVIRPFVCKGILYYVSITPGVVIHIRDSDNSVRTLASHIIDHPDYSQMVSPPSTGYMAMPISATACLAYAINGTCHIITIDTDNISISHKTVPLPDIVAAPNFIMRFARYDRIRGRYYIVLACGGRAEHVSATIMHLCDNFYIMTILHYMGNDICPVIIGSALYFGGKYAINVDTCAVTPCEYSGDNIMCMLSDNVSIGVTSEYIVYTNHIDNTTYYKPHDAEIVGPGCYPLVAH